MTRIATVVHHRVNVVDAPETVSWPDSNSIRAHAMPPPPKANAPASVVHESHGVMELFERRIEWAERLGSHHGGAQHQAAGMSGVPQESQIAVVGGSAVSAGQDTLTTGLVQSLAEDRG